MDDFYAHLRTLQTEGLPLALATIIRVRGSVPREVGTHMVIHPLGQHVGTVGGGCGEADVIRSGMAALQTGEPALLTVDLTDPVSMQSLGACGGTMDVFIEPWLPDRALDFPPTTRPEAPQARVVVVRAPAGQAELVGREVLLWLDHAPPDDLRLGPLTPKLLDDAVAALHTRRHTTLSYPTETGPLEAFVEVLNSPPTLLIVGAGHIAVPLAQLGALCDYRVVVVDDRPRYANRQRFPQAAEVITAEIGPAVGAFPVTLDTYVVLVTRGHQHDMQALLQLIDRPCAYIGMIGSRRRIRGVLELLQQDYGMPPEQVAHVYAPIGLDIGAETPAEIAVAIMAELTLVRRGGSGSPLSDALHQRGGRIHPARVQRRARPMTDATP